MGAEYTTRVFSKKDHFKSIIEFYHQFFEFTTIGENMIMHVLHQDKKNYFSVKVKVV